MQNIKEKMRQLIYNTSPKLLLFNSVLIVCVVSLCIIIAVEALLNYEQMGLLIMEALLVYLIVMIVLGNRYSSMLSLISGAIMLPLNLFILPYLYLFAEGGGISSGMPLWYAFGILLLFLVTEGKVFWGLLAATIIVDMGSIIYSYVNPEIQNVVVGSFYYYEDNMLAILCVSLAIGITLKYYRMWEKKQRCQVQQAVVAAEQEKKKAQQADLVKSQLLLSISQGIRVPMNTVIGMTDMAKYNLDDTAKVLECLNKVSDSSQQLLYLMDNILDLSQIQVNKLKLRELPFNIEEVIEGIRDTFEQSTQEKRISFKVSYEDLHHKSVVGDSQRLKQILMNLISNGIHFTEPGGSIAVSVVELEHAGVEQAKYALVVRDTGIGMTQQFVKEKIFSLFERADDPYVRKTEGRGIGMCVVKGIADAMGAKLHIDSKLGEGTSVSVEFCLKIDEMENVYREENGNFMINAFGKNILVVEDNDINMEIIHNILQRSKANIVGAADAETALEILQESEEWYFDLIFMDIQLPGMDGYSAARTIRCMDRGDVTYLPIIAMTANAFAQDIEKALNSGMNAHIAKPINTDDLYQRLYYYLYVIPHDR